MIVINANTTVSVLNCIDFAKQDHSSLGKFVVRLSIPGSNIFFEQACSGGSR